MNFSRALEAVKVGQKITRPGWNGKGMHIEMQRPDQGSKMTCPYLFMFRGRTSTDLQSLTPWVPSMGDLLAEDWQTLSETVASQKQVTKLYGYTSQRGHTIYRETEFSGNQYLKREQSKDKVLLQ